MSNGKAKSGPPASPERGFAAQIFAKAAIGVICLLVFLALVSNHRDDIHILQQGIVDARIHNWIGRVGAFLSHHLLYLLGLAAYPAVLLMLFCVASRCFNPRNRPVSALYYLGIGAFIVGLSMLLGVFPDFFLSWQESYNLLELPGGAIGQRLCAPASEVILANQARLPMPSGWLWFFVNSTGCVIISAGLMLAGLISVWHYDWGEQTTALWTKSFSEWRESLSEKGDGQAGDKAEAVTDRQTRAEQRAAERELRAAEKEAEREARAAEKAAEKESRIAAREAARAEREAEKAADRKGDDVAEWEAPRASVPLPVPTAPPKPEPEVEPRPEPRPEPEPEPDPELELEPDRPLSEPRNVSPARPVGGAAQAIRKPGQAAPTTAAPAPVKATPTPMPTSHTDYALPPIKLLSEADVADIPKDIEQKKKVLQETLESFGIDAEVGDATCGPRVTLYEIKPAPGVKVEKISNLANNIAMNLKAESLRILTPIPGKGTVGIEAPNSVSSTVSLRSLFESSEWQNSRAQIPIALGKDISGKPVILDLSRAPHLMIAGATGSGKSVCINTLILSLLYRFKPDQCKMILVDPKVVEFSGYATLPHLVTPVVTDSKKVPIALRWVINQMEWRYEILSKVGVRNLASFNSRRISDEPEIDDDGVKIPEKLPFLVVIIDELADIMMTSKKEVETSLARIAQLARAVGIHTVIATQRPSVNIITGVIKANYPTRIAFQVSSVPDSRTILDTKGAESLLGRGDMLYRPPGGAKLSRVQGAMVEDKEIEQIVQFCAAQAEPDFAEDVFQGSGDKGRPAAASFGNDEEGPSIIPADDDEEALIQQAIQVILRDRRATTSHLQRRLRIGYNRASLIIEELEERGIVGPQIGQNPREILITDDADQEEEEELQDDDI